MSTPVNVDVINNLLSTTLDAKLPRLSELMFKENPFIRDVLGLDDPFELSRDDINFIKWALGKRSKATRQEAVRRLETAKALPKKRKRKVTWSTDMIRYEREPINFDEQEGK